MSEVATPMSVAHEMTSHAVPSSKAVAPACQSFSFAPQRQKTGIVEVIGGAVSLAVGAFLFSQISHTSSLTVQLAILGAVGTIGGLGLWIKAIGDLFGRLVIDESGIAIRPGLTGYTIRWNELDRWQVQLTTAQYPDASSVLFWTKDEPCAMFIPNSCLSPMDRVQIRRTLQTYAAQKEAAC